MSCGIIIAAAGQGKRMGAGINKLFLELNGKPILLHSLEKFYQKKWVNEIVVVANPYEIDVVKKLLKGNNLDVTAVIPGGIERQNSIYNGLSYLNSEYIMIHDGARPLISSDKLDELYEKVQTLKAVVLGVPSKDTIKVVDNSNIIKYTPERKSLWTIQTPQAFSSSLIIEAYKKAEVEGYQGTDDSSLVERLGVSVNVLMGDYSNLKITTSEDLTVAQSILSSWRNYI
ncbi:MAG: 2-C-methyl-D-erythritol 4-phosphate cytidylyltransferase [Vulcanibacillus sp.]